MLFENGERKKKKKKKKKSTDLNNIVIIPHKSATKENPKSQFCPKENPKSQFGPAKANHTRILYSVTPSQPPDALAYKTGDEE
jgi:hypothetical protein